MSIDLRKSAQYWKQDLTTIPQPLRPQILNKLFYCKDSWAHFFMAFSDF